MIFFKFHFEENILDNVHNVIISAKHLHPTPTNDDFKTNQTKKSTSYLSHTSPVRILTQPRIMIYKTYISKIDCIFIALNIL